MPERMRITLLLLVTAATLGLCVAAQEADIEQMINEAVIRARVETTFALNEHLNPLKIAVSVDGDEVTLSGKVDSAIEKELAEQLALGAEGVGVVVNELEVETPEDPVTEKPEWRRRVADATLVAAVKSRLLYHTGLDAAAISVRSEDGVVTISGTVDSEAERELVRQVAGNTDGVTLLRDELDVTPRDDEPGALREGYESLKSRMSDAWVKQRVQTSIMLDRNVSIRDVDVEVAGGVCVLSGSVLSNEQRELVEAIAANTDGVKEVVNTITLK